MPKWKSPIFSDIRNAIGESVIFSQWKGRPYFRSYVKPANPRTLAQQAHRDLMKLLVARYQQISADIDAKKAWNARALEYVLSGYNLFVKWGRASYIKVTPTSGTAPLNVTITYKSAIPASEAVILEYDGEGYGMINEPGQLKTGEEATFTYTIQRTGTFEFYLGTWGVKKPNQISEDFWNAITKWYPDVTQGKAVEAKVIVT